MGWSPITWVAILAGALVVFLIVQYVYLGVILSWEDQKTRDLEYYGLPPEGRAGFKRTLRRHARFLFPVLRLVGKFSSFTFEKASFQHRGVSGPRGTCSLESFQRADDYQARPEDVFVVTQMKCGTTWMQHVVYEILHRGNGDLVEDGTALYAVSPWLEALKCVPVDEAPLVGAKRPSRVIKTHLPTSLCPFGPEARYVYVARHPVSCFASCADFIATNVGAMAPDLAVVEEWFCSEELMWWGTWPAHVMGWWQLAQANDNVLFVHFEDMKRDLPGIVREVAGFLGVEPLATGEIENVVHKCGFAYMQAHKEAFEMHPPHILATDAELFVKGTADRHKDVPEEVRQRVRGWCAAELAGSDYPLGRIYPDLVVVGGSD